MRRIANIAATLSALCAAQPLPAQIQPFPSPHGLTSPRTNLERAFLACWFVEMEPLGMLGSLYPPPQWVWEPSVGRHERSYGMLSIGETRWRQIASRIPVPGYPVAYPVPFSHIHANEPMWSWVAFCAWISTMRHPGSPTEPPTIENMVRMWAVGEGWESDPAGVAYWQRARRFVF